MTKLADRLKEPFSETTRKVRNHLMVSGLLGVLVSDVGLIPSKISALGIEFTGIEQSNLLKLLLAILIYYTATFTIYALSELSAGKLNEAEESIVTDSERAPLEIALEVFNPNAKHRYDSQKLKSGALGFLRCSYELLVPVIWGLYSAYSVAQSIQ